MVLVILSLPTQTATRLKLALGGFFLPLFGLASSTHTLAERAGNALSPRQALLDQIEQLKRQNQELQLHVMQSTQLWLENGQLRQALGWQQRTPWKLDKNLKLARVTLRDPANWWRTLRIDLGRRDGIVANLPVLAPEGGLVGRINEAGFSSSQVVLVGDPNCRVSALVENENPQDRTSVNGIILGSASSLLDSSIVNLTFIAGRQSAIKPGLRVVTSGLGGIFPRGIPIGHVIDSTSVELGLYTEARVKMLANLEHLEEVWVLFP